MRKSLYFLTILIVSMGIALSGCSLTGYTFAKKTDIDAQITKARNETQSQMETLRNRELSLLRQVITENEARLQAAADHAFKGIVVFGTLKDDQISRPTLIMGQSLNLTATQLPPATAKAQIAALEALKSELDEVKTTTAALKQRYEAELATARAEGQAKMQRIEKLTTDLTNIQVEKERVLTNGAKIERELQDKKDEIQNKDLAEARESEAAAKKNEALKKWLMAGLGIIALAAGAAAVFVPIPTVKTWGTLVGVAAAGLAFSVPFIEPFHVLVAILCICVPVGLRIVWVYHKERADQTDTIRGIQELKTKKPEVFKEHVAPILSQWHTDPKTVERIDKRLKEVGDA